MRNWSLIVLSVFAIIINCTSEKPERIELAALNLFLTTDADIDSVFVSNIAQDKLFKFLPYSDTILIDSDSTINDLYNIIFFSGGAHRMNQLWLNGKRIIIKGNVNNKLQMEIDTVIGSDLYYKSIDFRNEQKELTESAKQDAALLNSFLLKSFARNIDNPFSTEIANRYFTRNVSDKNALRKIYELQVKQDSEIANHFLNPYREIEKILLESKVDLSEFQFYNTKGELIKVDLTKDKKYIIDFWFVGCAPCVQDHKLMAKKMALLKKSNVEVVGISIDQNQEVWKNYLKTKKYNWTNVREINDSEKRASRDMLIGNFPTYLLIDQKGNVLYRTFSFTDILKHLNIKT